MTALGKLDEPGVTEALLEVLRDDNPEVLQAAFAALKNRGADQVVPRIVVVLRHPVSVVRTLAAQWLDQSKWRPENRTEECWFCVANHQFGRAAQLGEQAIPALEQALASVPARFGIAIIGALGRIQHPDALAVLRRALGNEDPGICIAAIESICTLLGDQSIEFIASVLNILSPRSGRRRESLARPAP